MTAKTLPIAVVARETGISTDLLRKWEIRHGFPKPLRSQAGVRGYPLDQVEILREIKRMIASGVRPGKAIKCCADGARSGQGTPPAARADDIINACLEAVRNHDAPALHALLDRNLFSRGVKGFIEQLAAPLTVAVGDAWLRGELRVHEEHLYSATLAGLLVELHRRLHLAASRPRILMTTLPGELHTLGLDMVRVLLAEAGAHCISLGAQTPLVEIAAAVNAYNIDILALSFSAAYPARLLNAELTELRILLPPELPIWIGGAGTLAVPHLPPGVQAFVTAADAVGVLRHLAMAHDFQSLVAKASA